MEEAELAQLRAQRMAEMQAVLGGERAPFTRNTERSGKPSWTNGDVHEAERDTHAHAHAQANIHRNTESHSRNTTLTDRKGEVQELMHQSVWSGEGETKKRNTT